MGIISRAKLVALPFFTADRIARYMAAGQLTSKQVVKYAVQSDFVMTQKAWKVLNADPSLIVRLECRKGIGLAYFGEDVGRLLTQKEIKPITVAKVLVKLIPKNGFTDEQVYAASRVISSHSIANQGEIITELAKLNYGLGKAIHAVL